VLSPDEKSMLESACVDLIGELEHLLAFSNVECEAGFLGESALIGNKMLHCLVKFSDGYLSGPRSTIVYELVEKGFQETKKTVDLATSQTLGTLRRIVGGQTATDQEVAAAHAEAGKAIANAVIASLGGGIRRLHDEGSVANDLCESLQPILVELRENWGGQ
jgi:hypothetical protein